MQKQIASFTTIVLRQTLLQSCAMNNVYRMRSDGANALFFKEIAHSRRLLQTMRGQAEIPIPVTADE
jgi:hypothetical protein